mgnify:CR=1 FL=1|jgi:hypothetical protein
MVIKNNFSYDEGTFEAIIITENMENILWLLNNNFPYNIKTYN